MRRRRRLLRRLIRLLPLILAALVLILILGLIIKGCGKSNEGSKMVFTKALTKDEVFRIGDEVCTAPEMRAFLATTQSEYERVYGVQIWNTSLDGVTLEEYVKDKVL